jgi:ankyrin repeat protein/serine/threonine protein kinase
MMTMAAGDCIELLELANSGKNDHSNNKKLSWRWIKATILARTSKDLLYASCSLPSPSWRNFVLDSETEGWKDKDVTFLESVPHALRLEKFLFRFYRIQGDSWEPHRHDVQQRYLDMDTDASSSAGDSSVHSIEDFREKQADKLAMSRRKARRQSYFGAAKSGKALQLLMAESDTDIQQVLTLLQQNPEQVRELSQDVHRRTCLDVGVVFGKPLDVITAVLDAWPNAIKQTDFSEKTILHTAMQFAAPAYVVDLVVTIWHRAVKAKDKEEQLPLHLAIFNKVSVNIVKMLIDSYPTSVKKKDNCDQIPLQLAMEHNASSPIVELLLNAWPDAVKKEDDRQITPLHLAVINSVSFEIIERLLNCCPGAIFVKDKSKRSTLYFAIKHRASCQVLQLLLDRWPEAAKRENDRGSTPLHLEVTKRASIEAVKLLVDACPSAIFATDASRQTSLHLAIAYKAPLEVIQYLLEKFPDAAKKKDQSKTSPLHYALTKNVSDDIINVLIAACPDAVQHRDKSNRTPLHVAIASGVSLAIIKRILDMWPVAVKRKDGNEQTPLHVGMANNASPEVVMLIFNAYPGAVHKTDRLKRTPLHLGMIAGTSAQVTQMMVNQWPEGVKKRDTHRHTPLQLAMKNNLSADIVLLLVNSCPGGVHKINNYKQNALHLAMSNNTSADAIRLILEREPDTARKEDKSKRTPLHLGMANSASTEAIKMLMDIWPEAAGIRDDHDQTPLHLGVANNASPDSIKMVIEAYPDAVKAKDKSEKTPLYLGLANNVSAEVVKLLVDIWPGAVMKQDKFKRTPLHLAIMNGASIDVIETILNKWPDAAKIGDCDDRSPLHWEMADRASPKVIKMLLDVVPDVANKKDNNRETPLGLGIAKDGSIDAIQILIDACPNAILTRTKDEESMLHGAIVSGQYKYVKILLLADMPIARDGVLRFRHGYSWTWLLSYRSADKRVNEILQEIVLDIIERDPDYRHHTKLLADAKDVTGNAASNIAFDKTKLAFRQRTCFMGRYNLHPPPFLHKSASSIAIAADDFGAVDDYKNKFSRFCSQSGETATLNEEQFKKLLKEVCVGEANPVPALDQSHRFSKEDFVKVCCEQLHGSPDNESRPVVIKFIQEEARFRKVVEILERYDLDSKYVVSILHTYQNIAPDGSRNGSVEGGMVHPSWRALKQDFEGFDHCIVMPKGDCDLHSIYFQERLDNATVRNYTQQIAEALQHLHHNHIVHGDVRMRNIIRVGGRMQLLDLDASAFLAECQNPPEGMTKYAGAKFASGILPPEMFTRINEGDTFLLKWKDHFGIISHTAQVELWNRIRPRNGIVVKTFNPSKVQQMEVQFGPKYLEIANERLDIWSFGMMLFKLLANQDFFNVDRDDNLKTDQDFLRVMKYDTQSLAVRLRGARIGDHSAVDLLKKILHPDPKERLGSFNQVLGHSFFISNEEKPVNKKSVRSAQEIRDEVPDGDHGELHQSFASLDTTITNTSRGELHQSFASLDTTITNTSEKGNSNSPSSPSNRKHKIKLLRNMYAMKNVIVSLNENSCPTAFCILPPLSIRQQLKDAAESTASGDIFSKVAGMWNYSSGLSSLRADAVEGKFLESIEFVGSEKLQMHLICERCYTVQEETGTWPVEVDQPEQIIPKILPIARGYLKKARAQNDNVSGLGRLFGLPTPDIPEGWWNDADNAVGNIQDIRESLRDYSILQAFMEGVDEKKRVKNQIECAVREFKGFLKEKDPENNWCRLSRVVLSGKNNAMWVCQDCMNVLETGRVVSDPLNVNVAEQHAKSISFQESRISSLSAHISQ